MNLYSGSRLHGVKVVVTVVVVLRIASIMSDRKINQTFIVGDEPVHNYDIWVVIDNRDTHLVIQARDSLQARAIAEQLYGHCYGVTLLS